eukprot:jgi/Tetstr1/430473/TSEL_020281.t1
MRLTGVCSRLRDVHTDPCNITMMHAYRKKGRAGGHGPDDLRVLLLPVSEHPRFARLLHHLIDNVKSAPLVPVTLAETNFWAVTANFWAVGPSEQPKSWTAASYNNAGRALYDRSSRR